MVDSPDFGRKDWREDPEVVLDILDGLLAAHGLEIVQFSDGIDDLYDISFAILKRDA